MIHVVFIVADTILIADFKDGLWHVTCQDNLTGKFEKATWTIEQFVSVSVLLIGEEETSLASLAYPVAEEAVKEWAKEVRPIP